MKDTPSHATQEHAVEFDTQINAEAEPTKKILSKTEKAFRKHRFFSIVFFLVSATMLSMIIFNPIMLQNALLPSVLITLGTFVLGFLNFRRAQNEKAELQSGAA